MKRTLLFLILSAITRLSWSQCVTTCSNYVCVPITFASFPSAGTNAIPSFAPNPDDGYTPPVQLGFNFNFYCTTYSTVLVYSNGLLQFDIGVPSTFPLGYDPAQYIPNPSSPTILNGIVAFKMDDLDPGVSGSVTYTTLGTSPNRMFVLTYSSVPIFTATPPTNLLNSGQIVLYETSNIIEIHTINAPVGPNLATQGIENALGTLATAAPGRNQTNWSATNSSYRFIPVAPATPTVVSGTTVLCQGTPMTYSIATQTGASAYNWTVPFGWIGTSTTSALNSTVNASGTVSVTVTYTCGTSAAGTLSVNVLPLPFISIVSPNPQVVCSGGNFTITPGGGLNYTLSPGGSVSNSSFVINNALNINSYSITGADANCAASNTAILAVTINPSPTIAVNSGTICDGQQFTISPTGTGADSYSVTGNFLFVSPPPGTYTYQVIGNNSTNGCNSLPVISSLTVSPNPTVTITSARSTICVGESEKLTAGGAATYSWNTGLTTGIITVTPATSIQYTVAGTTAEGCTRFKTINIIVVPCTGIESNSAQNKGVSVFPNPTTGVLNIQLKNMAVNASIEIYDATGRMVLNQKSVSNDNYLSIADQPNGLYYIKIKNSGKYETMKIIKE